MQTTFKYPILKSELKDKILNPKDKSCPFHDYIGNENAVKAAINLAKSAFENKTSKIGTIYNDRLIAKKDKETGKDMPDPFRIRLSGPASVGKTTFAKKLIKLIGTNYDTGKWLMPFAEVDATSIKSSEQIIAKIKTAMQEKGLSLFEEERNGLFHAEFPPLALFIDEVHALPNQVKEGLLKMTEGNDGIFETETHRFNCKAMYIILGTTNPGKLPRALKSRFVQINLEKHTLEQVAQIIQNEVGWEMSYCLKLAKMKPLPREAKEIANMIERTRKVENCSLQKAFDEIIQNFNLTESGLSHRALDVLDALYVSQETGLSKKNICAQLSNMDEEEFESDIIPQLLTNPPLITISQKHRITDAGIKELEKWKCNA